ncbi:MAG: primosomal protein N', partial [Clostridiales bacterium]|nr:primosomal protein N' [Clostridiales bacterium]
MKYAEVIVDIAASEVDKIFDYILPDGVHVGQRVLVPFGKSLIEGYVIAEKDESRLAPERLKSIVRAQEDFAVITPEMLGMMDYMRMRYRLRHVDALRCFLPAEMRKGRVHRLVRGVLTLADGVSEADLPALVGTRSAPQMLAALALAQAGEIASVDFSKRFSAATAAALRKKGVASLVYRPVLRTPHPRLTPMPPKDITLRPAQERCIADITASPATFLLHGITGSGKTEVYLRCIEEVLRLGKTALLLEPEIALTPQVLRIFRQRFGSDVAILHSGLSAGERFDEWNRCLCGEARVCIGARGAVFAPLQNLGILIIDEEHEPSYQSENTPRYFAHELAAFRRDFNGCRLVLGSATPSIDSYRRALSGEYRLLELPERINERPLPALRMVDMCGESAMGNNSIFSRALMHELEKCVESGNQAMLFINRRGFASFQMCRACGYVKKCANCDVSMVYHRAEGVLKCHYCAAREAALTVCPVCGSPHIRMGAVGTERVAQELQTHFPDLAIARLDRDATATKDAMVDILGAFSRGETRILVGTQMIAKGHDFPNVTLVGVLDGDMSLHVSDFRATERTFQLITQVSGRAGRADLSGTVIIQSYSPRHYVYRFAQNGDYKGFFAKEI